MSLPHFQLGDMLVIGAYPAKLLKALAVVAETLHPAYNALEDRRKLDNSKEACLFASLAVRDFLVAIGYADATVKPCTLVMRAERDGQEVHSLGIGVPDDADRPDKFNGHAVVVVPSAGILIDVTLYQAIREQWQGALTGMMALAYEPHSGRKLRELQQIGGMSFSATDAPMTFEIAWGDRPDINWKRQPDFRDTDSVRRRRAVVKVLHEKFGTFEEE